MRQYRGLADIYDYLVAGVDFEGWIDYVESIIKKFSCKPDTVLDLACGTGNTIIPFARRGYQSYGLDISPEMIEMARLKTRDEGLDIKFSVQDIRDFALPESMDLVTCFHDGLNYIINEEDVKKVFSCVYGCLAPGGMFIFDLNAVSWIGETAPGPVVIEEPDLTIIYETAHNREDGLWSVVITGFVREGELFRKFTETHCERGYNPKIINELLSATGLETLGLYDAFTFSDIHQGSRRHFYVTRKPERGFA
jgi:SAM-dependent methyltransferase